MSDIIEAGGWFPEGNREALESLIREHNVQSVIEIGSLFGLSAIWFARRVEEVICIDRWYEEANYVSNNNVYGTLRRWELPRDFFPIFRDNVMRSGFWHKITPIRGHSHYVSGEIDKIVDLVYVDGDHTYEGCKRDIEIYREKARHVICGDDYGECEGYGVIEAVRDVLPRHQHCGRFWWANPRQ